MLTLVHRLAFAAALLGAVAAASAAPVQLAGQSPFTVAARDGAQSDASGPPLVQHFVAPAGATLDKIVWWGYSPDNASADPDNFLVTLGSTLLTGSLTSVLDGTLTKYTLDIADILLTATSLSIQNDVGSFSWYWQNATDVQYVDDASFKAAYSLIGTAAASVPEPGTLALVGVAGLTAMASMVARRRRG